MDILEYIEQHSTPENEALQQIVHTTHIEMINPRMMSGHIQGRVLSMFSQMICPQRILELGTFTAYSTLCLAEGLPDDGILVTIEHNDELEDMILRNLALSPWGDKVQLVIGDAIEWLSAQPADFILPRRCAPHLRRQGNHRHHPVCHLRRIHHLAGD